MENMTKAKFEKSKKAITFCMSFDPITGESNHDFLEGYRWEWMRDLIAKDFPERFFAAKMNKAAAKLRAKEVFGF